MCSDCIWGEYFGILKCYFFLSFIYEIMPYHILGFHINLSLAWDLNSEIEYIKKYSSHYRTQYSDKKADKNLKMYLVFSLSVLGGDYWLFDLCFAI